MLLCLRKDILNMIAKVETERYGKINGLTVSTKQKGRKIQGNKNMRGNMCNWGVMFSFERRS
jgi:hypothetical protein